MLHLVTCQKVGESTCSAPTQRAADRRHLTASWMHSYCSALLLAVLDIDAVGTFTMCLAARPFLAQQQQHQAGGLIVNISATLHYTAAWYQAHVMAAKVSPPMQLW